MAIKFTDGMKLELWVWDRGELEGYAIYLNGQYLTEGSTIARRYPIDPPKGNEVIAIHFGGADGGATKIVDAAQDNSVVEHQDDGVRHSYIITT